jgi:hypothetical protein
LIKQLAVENRLWGAKPIRGELRKLGIRVSKRTVQRYMRHARKALPPRTHLRSNLGDVPEESRSRNLGM